jgi:hypothetical protein
LLLHRVREPAGTERDGENRGEGFARDSDRMAAALDVYWTSVIDNGLNTAIGSGAALPRIIHNKSAAVVRSGRGAKGAQPCLTRTKAEITTGKNARMSAGRLSSGKQASARSIVSINGR